VLDQSPLENRLEVINMAMKVIATYRTSRIIELDQTGQQEQLWKQNPSVGTFCEPSDDVCGGEDKALLAGEVAADAGAA